MNPRKILVVDDSKMMHKMYEVMLRQYPLVYARDGREAFDRLREHGDVDLVLFAVGTPGIDAPEFLAQMSREGMRSDLAVILVSLEGREEETARGLEAGALAYIKKPFHAEELLDVIARAEPPGEP